MKLIKLGRKEPNEKAVNSLSKLGFNIGTIEKIRGNFSIQFPDNQHLSLKVENESFDRTASRVFCNGVQVITIIEKTAIYDSWVQFNIVPENEIDESLSRPPEKKVELTDFQKRLIDRIKQVDFIVLGGGAQAGYGRDIGSQLSLLRNLKAENVEEHDQLIESDSSCKKLYDLFPGWEDTKNLQRYYMDQDQGIFMALGSEAVRRGEDPAECLVM